MDRSRALAEFDRTMRIDPPSEPESSIDRTGGLVRMIGPTAWIAFSKLDSQSAPGVVREETDRFRAAGVELEWKVFGHDTPPELSALLAEAGFVPDLPETLMVLELSGTTSFGPAPEGIRIERVEDRTALQEAVELSERAFGPHEGWSPEAYTPRLGDPTFEAFVARVGSEVVSAGRLEMPKDRPFASLWGGSTSPTFRGRGIYRALVRDRAEWARDRGFRYLTVDARETSRPILERIGFEPLTSIVGWILRPIPSTP